VIVVALGAKPPPIWTVRARSITDNGSQLKVVVEDVVRNNSATLGVIVYLAQTVAISKTDRIFSNHDQRCRGAGLSVSEADMRRLTWRYAVSKVQISVALESQKHSFMRRFFYGADQSIYKSVTLGTFEQQALEVLIASSRKRQLI
jgi:hypothetical protein